MKKKSAASGKDPNKEKVVIKREKKVIAVFIDGVGLDRACRRIKRKVNLAALVKGLTTGTVPVFARYYTIIPFEDDSRHRAFLDAVNRSGLDVIAKRLPPKTVERQVTIDSEISVDLMAFGLNHLNNYDLSNDKIEFLSQYSGNQAFSNPDHQSNTADANQNLPEKVKRIAIIVCPSRELSYALGFLKNIGVDTVSADFSDYAGSDVLKSAAKWVDLSDSQTIWQD